MKIEKIPVIYKIKRFFNQIARVIDWLPIIWKSYDFDYAYSLIMFKHQLERMEKFFRSDKVYTESALHKASRMRTAIDLMEKVMEEEYAMEYQKEVEKLYGKYNFDVDERRFLVTKWERNYTKEELKAIEAHKTELFKKSLKKHEKAKRVLWKFIAHNIEGWWD